MTTHIKLRPLVVHDSASSQSGFSDASFTPDSSPSVRAHCALPSANRGGHKLVPAPPDSGSSAGKDTGVSVLRSKLRRLLGAHSTTSPPAPKPATPPSQTAALRCASTADLQDRPPPPSAPNATRAASSVPVSPAISGVTGGPRGRFAGTAILLPNSLASTPPATPGGNAIASPIAPSPRSGPVPPVTAPNGAAPPPRCPSASSARSPSLRRAVSFSPTATTFPPLGSPNVPSPPAAAQPPQQQLPNGGGAGGAQGIVVGGGGGSTAVRPSLSSGNSFVASASRMSSMVVVPEDEALPEDPGQTEYCLPLSAGSIGGLPRTTAPQMADYILLRNGRVSAADSDTPLPPGLTSPPQPPADGAAYITSCHAGGGGAALQLSSPLSSRMSPCAAGLESQRITSSSSSSVVGASGNGYIDFGSAGVQAQQTSLPGGGGGGRGSWSSDASATHGPFLAAATAAALALLEPSAPPPLSPHYQHHQQMQQLRSAPIKGGGPRGPGAEPGRPLSSSSSTAGAAATVAAASPRATQFHHLLAVPGGASAAAGPAAAAAAAAAGGHANLQGTFAPAGAQLPLQLPNHTSIPPTLTRGMSALHLMSAGGGGGGGGARGGGSSSSPWNTAGAVGGSAAAAVQEAPPTPVTVAAAIAAKQSPIRRAHSTIDSSARSQPETPNGPPGVLMAVGGSLPSEMKRKEWRVEDFTMLKRLYKGNYSAVHKALCRISMRLVVIKTYDTTRMTELARNHVKREAMLHAPLEHDNILNLFAVFSQGPYVMLVEEVAEGGDLYHVLKSIPGHRLLEDRAVAGVVVPLLRSLSYLHEQGICHRDIKLENILFSDRQHTRMLLADFGIALSLRQERAVTRAGTTEYMSPEQLRCPFKRHPADNKDRTDLHYGLGVDVWATGVLTFELLHGYPPFLGATREETEHLIMTAEVQVAPQLSHGARDFVLCCLHKDPADRPTVMQLLQHSWVRQHMRQLR